MNEDQFNRTAELMFGATTSRPAPAPSVPALDAATDEMAQRLFGNAPRPQAQQLNEQQTTEDEMAQKMFGETDPLLVHGDAGRAIERSAMEDLMLSPDEASAAAREWGEVFQTFGLNATESAALAEVGVAAFARPATPELVTQWTEDSTVALQREFGMAGARQALDDARELLDQLGSRELIDVLHSTGLGSHPAVVLRLAHRARALRNAGKLR